MRRVSIATRDELIAALADRYSEGRLERGRILDEFVALTGYHRKARNARAAVGAHRCPSRRETRPPALWRGSPASTDPVVGGVRPGVRQAIEATAAILDRCCARWPANCGRDKGMLAARVEPENGGRSIEPTRHEATGTLRMSQW